MAKHKFSYYYTKSKAKLIKGHYFKIEDTNGYLFSQGKYITKIEKSELPIYFIPIRINGYDGYLSLKNIKDLYYIPNYASKNYAFENDHLYISYNKPLIKCQNDIYGNQEYCRNYDIVLTGKQIPIFINKVETIKEINVTKIKTKLQEKNEWYNKLKDT